MGRPLGALKGRTEQANEFARWLRRITTGVTVRTLEEDFPYGKSSWSGFRDGSRLPPADLVEQVAARYLREPAMRKRQLEHGLALLAAAQQAAKALEDDTANSNPDLSVMLAAHRRFDPMTAALLRLDDARLRQIDAMQKLAASERRREELEAMVSVLEQRITILESERDQAREETRAELQRELQMSLEYRHQADEKLKHARSAEERARQLRLAAEKQVARERVALLRVDRDAATDAVSPLAPGSSLADDLQLPPLHHIRELLDIAQEQLDAQDDELDDLGEQLGAEVAEGAVDDPMAARIVWGQVVDTDVPAPSLDNAGKPVTSKDGSQAVRELGPATVPEAGFAAVAGGQRAGSVGLVSGLNAVSTPEALSTALSRLLRRAGVQSIGQLTAMFPADMKDDVFDTAVSRWIDGDDLPDTWPHLEALVRLMGATNDEVVAFQQAYDRIVSSRSAAWFSSAGDLADLAPFTRGLQRIIRPSATPKTRTGDWLLTLFAPAAIVALTTAYTAGLQASPGPGPAQLLGYGAVLLSACVLILLVTTRVTVLCARPERPLLHKRFTTASLATSLLAMPAGLVLPWLVDCDTPGRWFAHLVGLV